MSAGSCNLSHVTKTHNFCLFLPKGSRHRTMFIIYYVFVWVNDELSNCDPVYTTLLIFISLTSTKYK